MKKKGFLIYILLLGFIFIPKNVNALSLTGNATVGRSAVMDTAYNYYYTSWTSLTSDSINSVPVPYNGGNYYQMGSEYVISVTLNGESTFNGHVRIPVVANTMYDYQLMNGLNENDFKFGFSPNFGVYNINPSNWSYSWECQTYSKPIGSTGLYIYHNYCYYDADFSFSLDQPLTGAYNFNFAVLNTIGNRSAYYYSGPDSSGNGIEFPVNASNMSYSNLAPIVRLNGSSGSGSSNTDTEQIVDSITDSTLQLQDAIQESYENLVNSQQVCNYYNISNISVDGFLKWDGSINSTTSQYWGIGDFIPISSNSLITPTSIYSGSSAAYYCFYNSSKVVLSCSLLNSSSLNIPLTIPSNSSYFRSSFAKGSNVPIYSICQNGNQAIADNIMNDTIDNFSGQGTLDDIGGSITTTTPITDLLALPITLLSAVFTGINGTCTRFDLGTLYGVRLTLPCIAPELYLGSTIWNAIDLLFCGFMIYNIAQLMIHDWDSITSAEDLFEETYTPKHTYKPKHGKE